MWSFVVTFAVAYVLWLFFNLDPSPPVFILGIVIAFAAAALGSHYLARNPNKNYLNPARWLGALVYFVDFVRALIIANLDMTMIILGFVKINPGVVKMPLKSDSDFILTGVSDSITLTPGTLTLEVDGESIYVHWITMATTEPAGARAAIFGSFEDNLRKVLE